MPRFVARYCLIFLSLIPVYSSADWFDTFKATASDEELLQFLYEMPKGGDLHHHMSGSAFAQWWLEAATDETDHGYRYYTKVRINNCREYGWQGFDTTPYHLMFQTIVHATWAALPACEQQEYVALESLSERERTGWLNAVVLDKPYEGREEFFEAHWQRLGDLIADPYLQGDLMARHFQAFSDEGLIYVEPQVTAFGYRTPLGEPISPASVAEIYRQRLAQDDVEDTGLTVRFQQAILRFLPDAEQSLRDAYHLVATNEPWVAINMVGREDDDKGYPLRFLPVFRELRREYSAVKLSIHAGEVDEPNDHVRDTLLLGADRIGHGLNLITDPDTMRLFRHGPYMIEINLISNLLLDYYDDFNAHPFPEYLRTGIPVALSTDDRGMWDSTMTDEFFVAVRAFNLSWDEIRLLSENSLRFAFVDDTTRAALLATYRERLADFEIDFESRGFKPLNNHPAPRRGFICRQYQLCETDEN